MAENPIDQKFEDLWRRLTTPAAPAVPRGPLPASSFSLLEEQKDLLHETIHTMRQRWTREKQEWQKVIEERTQRIQELSREKGQLESRLAEILEEQASLRTEFQSTLNMKSVQAQEEAATLARQKRGYEIELKSLEEQVQHMLDSHKAETARYEAALAWWKEQEKTWNQLVLQREAEIDTLKRRLSESEAQSAERLGKLQQEKSERAQDKDSQGRMHRDEIEKWKAVVSTRDLEMESLREILKRAEEDIARLKKDKHGLEVTYQAALEHKARLSDELNALTTSREAERSQWRELWDKEKTARDRWAGDFQEWETMLREERIQWLSQFEKEVQEKDKFSRKIDISIERLKETVWTFPLWTAIQDRLRGQDASPRPLLRGFAINKRFWMFAGGTALSMLLVFQFLNLGPAHFKVPAAHASGVAVSEDRLWFVDWMDGLIVETTRRKPSQIVAKAAPLDDFHPVAIRWVNGHLWTLDPWSKILREHAPVAPYKILREWTVAADAPADLAWDGEAFWVLDRDNQLLKRFAAGRFDDPDKILALPPQWHLVAVDFFEGEFWGYDDTAGVLRQFVARPHLRQIKRYELSPYDDLAAPLTAVSVSKHALWSLSEKSVTLLRWYRWRLAWKAWRNS